MKIIVVSFLVAILAVPVMVALFRIVTTISGLIPDLYFAPMSLALTFAILTMVWGLFWSDLQVSVFVFFKEIGNR